MPDPVELSTPPVDVTPPPEPASISSHAEQFDPKRPSPAPEAEPIAATNQSEADRGRHRAKSQRASAEDVPRIAELTKKLRAAEAERDEWKSKHTPAPIAEPITPTPIAATSISSPAKPSWDTFEGEIGTKYETWPDAMFAYKDAQDHWASAESAATQQQAQTAKESEAIYEAYRKDVNAHLARTTEFAKAHPDFDDVTKDIGTRTLPPALIAAIVRSDNSPYLMYALGQQPDLADDIYIAARALPQTDESVAILQRRHLSKLTTQAASIGSAAGVRSRTAPPPPNPMRTGPMKAGDDPPAPGHSLADHAKHYGPKRR